VAGATAGSVTGRHWLGTILLSPSYWEHRASQDFSPGAHRSSGCCLRPTCLLGWALAESECGNAMDECEQEAAPVWAGCPLGERAEQTLHGTTAWAGPQVFFQITCYMGFPNVCWDFPVGWSSLLLLNCSPKEEGACETLEISSCQMLSFSVGGNGMLRPTWPKAGVLYQCTECYVESWCLPPDQPQTLCALNLDKLRLMPHSFCETSLSPRSSFMC